MERCWSGQSALKVFCNLDPVSLQLDLAPPKGWRSLTPNTNRRQWHKWVLDKSQVFTPDQMERLHQGFHETAPRPLTPDWQTMQGVAGPVSGPFSAPPNQLPKNFQISSSTLKCLLWFLTNRCHWDKNVQSSLTQSSVWLPITTPVSTPNATFGASFDEANGRHAISLVTWHTQNPLSLISPHNKACHLGAGAWTQGKMTVTMFFLLLWGLKLQLLNSQNPAVVEDRGYSGCWALSSEPGRGNKMGKLLAVTEPTIRQETSACWQCSDHVHVTGEPDLGETEMQASWRMFLVVSLF